MIQPELRKRLLAMGLDVEALLRCVGAACNDRTDKRSSLASLEPRLIEALKAMLMDD